MGENQKASEWQAQITKVLSGHIDPTSLKGRSLEELVEEVSIYHQELEYQNQELVRVQEQILRAQEDIKASRQHFVSLFHEAPIAYVVIDSQHRIAAANHEFARLIGEEGDALAGTSFQQWVTPESQDSLYFHLQQLSKHSHADPLQLHMVNPNGNRLVNIQSRLVVLDEGRQIRISLVDVTEKEQAEERLADRDRLLTKLSQQVPGAIFQYRIHSNGKASFPFVSDGIWDIFEVAPRVLTKDAAGVFARIHPEDRESVLQSMRQSQNSLTMWQSEHRVLLPQKGLRWIRLHARPEAREDKSVVWHGYLADITEAKKAESHLQFQLAFERLVSDISSNFIRRPVDRLTEGIDYALTHVGEFFHVDHAYVFQFVGDGKTMEKNHAWRSLHCTASVEGDRIMLLENYPWWQAKLQVEDVVYIPSVEHMSQEAGVEQEVLRARGVRSTIWVPMRIDGDLHGFLGLDAVRSQITFDSEHIVLLKLIAELISNAMARQMANEKIRFVSFHDNLTNLYNRRFFDEELRRLDVERNMPLTLLMFDVDGLKLTNDAFGHTEGDRLLIRVAEVLRQECRGDDIIARVGGDEFIIILPKTTSSELQPFVERIHQRFEQETVHGIPVSVACGWATKSSAQEQMGSIYRTAENSMYRNKLVQHRGRRKKVIGRLMDMLCERYSEEEKHSNRVALLTAALAEQLGFNQTDVRRVFQAGRLHDIGKIGLKSEILTQTLPLSTSQWTEVRRHPEVGYSILSSVNEYASITEEVLAHHERWDGTGYPKGSSGANIPLVARILAVADAYEAITSSRPYRRARTHDQALQEIEKSAGSQFDPDVVQSFLELMKRGETGAIKTVSHLKVEG